MDTAYSTEDLAFRDEVRGSLMKPTHPNCRRACALPITKMPSRSGSASFTKKVGLRPIGPRNTAARAGQQRKSTSTKPSDPLPASRTWCLLVW